MIYKVSRIKEVGLPLKAYEDLLAFKIYSFDVGLLGAMSELSQTTLLDETKLFKEFKGSLTEQFVLQQIKLNFKNVFYWTSNSGRAEVDFIVQNENDVIPIEAKAGLNLQAKSLNDYRGIFHPKCSIRASLASFKQTDDLIDLPLYAMDILKEIKNKK